MKYIIDTNNFPLSDYTKWVHDNATPLTDCDNAISRSAVIELFKTYWRCFVDNDNMEIFKGVINSLPSVNPTTDLSKIRAEIIDKYMTADGRMGSVSADILKIIDKYSKGGDSDA